jgi:hypothetical protein
MLIASTYSDLLLGISPMGISANLGCLPAIAANALDFRVVPFWGKFTPITALIFINKLREFLGVL